MRPIIRIKNLGKQYTIGARQAGYQTLRESLTEAAWAPLRWLRRRPPAEDNTIWALKDINLEVRPGEVVGIIGRNGAGKSTLLKVLSRITEPTAGQVELFGRVGSLLEVGTGFHPELTGRDNIYLNGAILGMKRREIARHFEAIVAFAEVEKFLDTPVKHYSSGMHMRLAFAVAAHLEPEILVVDEVLAVGDSQFQNKCLGKIDDVARAGRTVLFVSHNMATVHKLCSRAVLLCQGHVACIGTPDNVIGQYIHSVERRGGIGNARLICQHPDLALLEATLNNTSLQYGDSLTLTMVWEARVPLRVGIECSIRDEKYAALSYYGSGTLEGLDLQFTPGRNVVALHFHRLPLAQGRYFIEIGAARTNQFFYVLMEDAVGFSVERSEPLSAGYWFGGARGPVFFPCTMETDLKMIPVGLNTAT
jgi:lipopolysaccharide transport system ATP-binding protein